jgi:hypothetical protein
MKNIVWISILVGYLATYSVLGFGGIIDDGLLSWHFLLPLLLGCFLAFMFLRLKNFQLSKGLIIAGLFVFLCTAVLHVYSAVMGSILGPTRGPVITTNTYLIKINIISLIIIYLLAAVINLSFDVKQQKKGLPVVPFLQWLVFILCIGLVTFLSVPVFSVLFMMVNWS